MIFDAGRDGSILGPYDSLKTLIFCGCWICSFV